MFTRHQRHESLTCGNSFFSKVVVYAGYQICLLDTKSVLDGYQIFTGYQIRKVDTKQAVWIPNWGQFGILGCHLATLVQLRSSAPKRHSSEKTPQRWRGVGDTVSYCQFSIFIHQKIEPKTGPEIEGKTSHTDCDV